MTGNKIPASYLARFLPSFGKPKPPPEETAAERFIREQL